MNLAFQVLLGGDFIPRFAEGSMVGTTGGAGHGFRAAGSEMLTFVLLPCLPTVLRILQPKLE